ncbi:MAG: helix-turn-helix domain-containing protein [Nocardioidaceae bacterium]
MPEAHPYFVRKARQALADAGGDPSVAGALAAWADDAKQTKDLRAGVIVAEDGEIVAETRYTPATPSTPGAAYVTGEDSKRWGLRGNQVGIALGQIRQQTGRRLIHVTYSEVCQGAARFLPEVQAGAERFRSARQSLGVRQSWLAERLDVTERTVRRWEDGTTPLKAGVWADLAAVAEDHSQTVLDVARTCRAASRQS